MTHNAALKMQIPEPKLAYMYDSEQSVRPSMDHAAFESSAVCANAA